MSIAEMDNDGQVVIMAFPVLEQLSITHEASYRYQKYVVENNTLFCGQFTVNLTVVDVWRSLTVSTHCGPEKETDRKENLRKTKEVDGTMTALDLFASLKARAEVRKSYSVKRNNAVDKFYKTQWISR